MRDEPDAHVADEFTAENRQWNWMLIKLAFQLKVDKFGGSFRLIADNDATLVASAFSSLKPARLSLGMKSSRTMQCPDLLRSPNHISL